MLTQVRLDHAGIAEILKSSAMRDLVRDAAEQIAGDVHVDANDGVVVDEYTTDRAAASVTIRDPRAALWQARDGTLTRAAAAVGLEVKSK